MAGKAVDSLMRNQEAIQATAKMLQDGEIPPEPFEEQINGGIAECCEVTVNGVGYSSGLNNGARIQAGLDIIRTLQEHEGFYPPVWVDNAESVTVLPEMKCQVIRLVVSEPDKKLRMEKSQIKEEVLV